MKWIIWQNRLQEVLSCTVRNKGMLIWWLCPDEHKITFLKFAKGPEDQFNSHLQKTHLLRSVSYLLILATENLFCRVSSRICNYRWLWFSFSLERLSAGLQWRRTLTIQRKVMAACPELKCCTLFPYKYTLNCIRYCIRILFMYVCMYLFIYL